MQATLPVNAFLEFFLGVGGTSENSYLNIAPLLSSLLLAKPVAVQEYLKGHLHLFLTQFVAYGQ